MMIKIGKKTIGEIIPDRKLFIKTSVNKSEHLFRVYDAWGMDSEYFEKVLLPSNYTIRVFEKEERTTYVTDAENYKKNGKYFHFKNEGEDHRAQIFLPRAYWKVIKS